MRRYDKNENDRNNYLNSAEHRMETRARYFRLATLQAYRTMKERLPVEDVKKDWAQFNSDFSEYLQTRIAYAYAIDNLKTRPKNRAPLPG